ncbi:uncharacterized protein LOC111106659 isoform X2 [Crassostrea virginica]
MERCFKRSECRIYTVIDKKKENSMILCITVNDAQSCYALTCSCQKNKKKRAIKSPYVTYEPKEKPNLEEKQIPAQCVVGAIIGVLVTCACIKRKSFKNIPEVNSLCIQGNNANEKQILSAFDDPEYSEIPENLQPLETSSKDSSQAVTIQKSPCRDHSLPSLDVKTNINNVNYQRNMSVLKKNVLSSHGKLSDSVCITMSRQQTDASGNTCVSEPFSAAYEIPTNKTGFVTCNVDPATGCNVYHSLEDIPLVENEEDGEKTPTKCSAKALYHVLSAEKETSLMEEDNDQHLVTDNTLFLNNKGDKPSLCTTNHRNNADKVCDRQENTTNMRMDITDAESRKAPVQSAGKFTCMDKTDSESIIKQVGRSNADNLCNLYHVEEDNPKFNINHEKNDCPTPISTSDKSQATETLYFVLSASSKPAAKEQIKIEAKNINISD